LKRKQKRKQDGARYGEAVLSPILFCGQLIRLKTRTGITQWNILCRWAFCLSLK
jgi:hypothetical protein